MTIRDVGSLDGHALSIKQLRGEDPIELMDLSGKRLTVLSATVIASLITSNAATKSLKCAATRVILSVNSPVNSR